MDDAFCSSKKKKKKRKAKQNESNTIYYEIWCICRIIILFPLCFLGTLGRYSAKN